MFSGGDSSGEGVNGYGHFQLPPQSVAACGLNNRSSTSGSIDWASLAQQWIQMRDFSGADISSTMPEAPPPPNISGENVTHIIAESQVQPNNYPVHSKKHRFDEKGEADMEMDDEEEGARAVNAPTEMQSTIPVIPLIQPNWFVPQPITAPLPCNNIDSNMSQQQQKTIPWDVWPPRPLAAIPTPVQCEVAKSTSHIPSLMKINIPDPNIAPLKPISDNQSENNSLSTMDAAKRKILPAWIREGLEKMEREKLKQLEKQQQTLKVATADQFNSEDFTHVTHHADLETVNNKNLSVLESDSSVNEEDENEGAVAIGAATCIANSSDMQLFINPEEVSTHLVEGLNCGKSYEQKLSDLMIVVRETLTELLLEVTNEEISNIAHDTIKSYKAKASTASVIPKSAISTITCKLGLAAYEDSSSDDDGSETEESVKEDNSSGSEEDIKDTIRAKRKAFSKISEEIEERIAETALREEEKLKYYTQQEQQEKEQETLQKNEESTGNYLDLPSGLNSYNTCKNRASGSVIGSTSYSSGKVFEKEFGETSDTKLQFSNGKRQKERTTRFSDNKDSKGTTIVTSSDYICNFKSNQIETVASRINTAVMQINADASMKTIPETATKNIDQAPDTAASAFEKGFSKVSKEKSHSRTKSRCVSHSSENNASSSDDSESTPTSNSSRNSSRNSRSSSLKHKTKHQVRHMSSSSFSRKSNSARTSDRYSRYSDHKSSRHRHHSSDSGDFSDEKYSNSKKHRSSHYRDHHERKSRRSRSRSRSRSKYSSSRRRH